jgi:phosphate-selective porin OprO and OprP
MRPTAPLGLLLAASLFAPAVARAEPPSPEVGWMFARAEPAVPGHIDPIVVAELDYWAHSAADFAEGTNGFSVGRLNLGAHVVLTSWCSMLAVVEWADESPHLLDAVVTLVPTRGWEINIGATKTPLFSTARDEFSWQLPVPELPMVVTALWPGRDAGIELHRLPTYALPIEGWLRFGNGSGNALGNDNDDYAVEGRLDLVLGRARPGASLAKPFGMRLGAGIRAKSAEDRPGITGTTADAFEFYRPTTVAGPRHVGEVHAVGLLGPVKLDAAVAVAQEGRLANSNGSPDAPRTPLDPVTSRGAYAELAWMITGQHRVIGAWPIQTPLSLAHWDGGAVEIAGRVERLDLERGAPDVTPGGATAGSVAVRWWTSRFLAISVAGYRYRYDAPPIEEPTRIGSWLGLIRTTVFAP